MQSMRLIITEAFPFTLHRRLYSMKTKTFDCVEMKRKAAIRIHEQLKGMSLEEKVAYWQKRHEIIRQEQEERQKERQKQDQFSV